MTPLPILIVAIFLGAGNCSYKIIHRSFFLLDVREVKNGNCASVIGIFWDEVFMVKKENRDVWPLLN